MSGVPPVSLGRRPFGERRAAAPHVPSDELPQHSSSIPFAGEAPELFPQVAFDPDGPVRGVGVLHEPHRSPCISIGSAPGLAVYIHGHYARGYTRGTQVALWGRLWLASRRVKRPMHNGGEVTEVRTLPDHATCRHKDYRLTCQQYEDLLSACGRCCETCGRPSTEAPGGKLVIDHDAEVGDWAVRGLICQSCNIQIRVDRPVPDWARVYLENQWYLRMLREANLSPECPPEPPLTCQRLQDFDGRIWWRRHDGWDAGHKKTRIHTWRDLHRRFGAHNLTFLHAGQKASRKSTSEHSTGRTAVIRVDSAEEAARALRRCMPEEILQKLAALLLDG
jgi:hypothetical protein